MDEGQKRQTSMCTHTHTQKHNKKKRKDGRKHCVNKVSNKLQTESKKRNETKMLEFYLAAIIGRIYVFHCRMAKFICEIVKTLSQFHSFFLVFLFFFICSRDTKKFSAKKSHLCDSHIPSTSGSNKLHSIKHADCHNTLGKSHIVFCVGLVDLMYFFVIFFFTLSPDLFDEKKECRICEYLCT